MRHPQSNQDLICELVSNFASEHRWNDVIGDINEIGCRAGPRGLPTRQEWTLELNKALKHIRETIESTLDDTEMMLYMGEWEEVSADPPKPVVDDSWVQLCGEKL